jgi:hypothetical protein
MCGNPNKSTAVFLGPLHLTGVVVEQIERTESGVLSLGLRGRECPAGAFAAVG